MATATFVPIATTTLGSSSSTIDFTSIPGTYTDLRLVLVTTATAGTANNVWMRFNSDTGTTYSNTTLYGTGSAAGSSSLTTQSKLSLNIDGGLGTTPPQMYTADIFNYAGSTFKSCLFIANEDKNGSGYIETEVGMWRSTSAITSINLLLSANSFAVNTTATLYGILKA